VCWKEQILENRKYKKRSVEKQKSHLARVTIGAAPQETLMPVSTNIKINFNLGSIYSSSFSSSKD